jgi:hypothetical protein
MYSRSIFNAILICLLVQFLGCEGAVEEPISELTSDGTPVDPVASFTAFLENELVRIKQISPKSTLSNDHSYNVEKTSSLVSPLIGTCTLDIGFPSDLEDGQMFWRAAFTIKYAWQNGAWVCTVGTFKILAYRVIRDTGEYQVLNSVGKEFMGRTSSFQGFNGLITTLNDGF